MTIAELFADARPAELGDQVLEALPIGGPLRSTLVK